MSSMYKKLAKERSKPVIHGCLEVFQSNLVETKAEDLELHDLHTTEQASNCIIPPYLFDRHVTELWSSARRATARRRSGSNPCGRGGDKDALYWWEPMGLGGSFLNARGRTLTASCPARSLTAKTQSAVQTTSRCQDQSPHNPSGCGWDYL
eukprot:1147922-Pelagomonas_calceolata.AAC.1